MATEPRRELSSTYFVQDRSSADERTRVEIQDTMITNAMGGVLPEQSDPSQLRRVIDVGCGTGGWLIELAKTYPAIELLVGADISIDMITYARENARTQQVSDRTEFHVMDALRMIEFPEEHFDLVNQRFGLSYLRTWDWANLIQKYQRVIRPGGILRITEGDVCGETNSPALTQLYDLARSAFYRAGHMFTPERTGVTSELPNLFQRFGLLNTERRSVLVHYSRDNPYLETFIEDMCLGFHTILPFLRKWTSLPENYDAIYQQALHEMHDPDFTADLELVTVWGENPLSQEKPGLVERH